MAKKGKRKKKGAGKQKSAAARLPMEPLADIGLEPEMEDLRQELHQSRVFDESEVGGSCANILRTLIGLVSITQHGCQLSASGSDVNYHRMPGPASYRSTMLFSYTT